MNWMNELRRILGRARKEPAMAPPPGHVTCEEAAERVFEWLDGELEDEMAARVGTHLETCAHCYPMLRFEQGFREAVARAAGAIEGAPGDLEARILKALDAEEGGQSAGPSGSS
jgi:mycothiol system anti-sigma-R factor